ncbi:MAG: InlB B-repeat-containing protein [Clostridia bacterium]|nr:InlB B-repeat-containing protein [Clostridia bacterium]
MISKFFKKLIFLMTMTLMALLLFSTMVSANDNNARYLMDAELMSDNNIAVLFIKGGSSTNNITSGGRLYLGIYNPSNNSWTETRVGGAVEPKEAALALYNDKAYVAYVTENDLIGYTYQTDTGWSDTVFITSNDANGDDRANTLYNVDIAVDSIGKAYIVYIDNDGAGDDTYKKADAMCATNASGSFVKTVLVNCTGYGDSWGKNYTEMLGTLKIAIDSEGSLISYATHIYDWTNSGAYNEYNFYFRSDTEQSLRTNSGGRIIEVAKAGDHKYTLVSQDGKYFVIDGNEKITDSEKAFTITTADMTLDQYNRVYYAAMNNNSLLFYQNGALVEDITATTPILSNHTKFATFKIGANQYVVYTGADNDKSLVFSKQNYSQMVEYLIPNEIKSWSELQTALNAGGTVKLTQDLTAGPNDSVLTVNSTVTLDLNGYIINRNLDTATLNGEVIWADEGSNLTIIDSRPNAEHSPNVTYRDLVTNEDVIVTGGIITGGYSQNNSGGIYYKWASGTISGGTIVGNKVTGTSNTGNAGGVLVRHSLVTMNGGAICGNEAVYGDGNTVVGGVGVFDTQGNSTAFTMSAGKITGNYTNSSDGSCLGGLYIYNGDLNISGNLKISGNMKNGENSNVVLSNTTKGRIINIAGVLTNGTQIGITPWRVVGDSNLTVTSGYNTYNSGKNPTQFFTSDTENIAIIKDSNNEVMLATEYTVTITYDEHGTAVADKAKAISGTVIYLQNTVTDPTTYRFKEWNVISGGITVANSRFTMGTSNVEIEAIFEEIPQYTLTFEANGGTGTMDAVVIGDGTAYTLPECAFTEPNGCVFSSWQIIPVGESNGIYRNPGNSISISQNYLIKATWQPILYNITYDLDGGTPPYFANPVQYTVQNSDITLGSPTKDGFVFAGWVGTDCPEPTVRFVIPTGSTGDRSYTAVWTVEYDLWIGSTRVRSIDANDVLKDGGSVVYNVETNTLTLNNATINGYGDDEQGYGIKYQGNTDLYIIANGTNVICDTGSRTVGSAGILTGSDIGQYPMSTNTASLIITVNENSSLAIQGGNVEGLTYPASYGICMWQDGGNVAINGKGTLTVSAGNSTYCYGICAADDLVINSTGTVEVNCPDGSYYAEGLHGKNVIINNGYIDVFSGNTQFASIAISTEGASYYGEDYGDVIINNGTVLAKGGAVPQNNGTNTYNQSKSYGIYSDRNFVINECVLIRATSLATEADISMALNKAPSFATEKLSGANTESGEPNVVYVAENNNSYKVFETPYTKPIARAKRITGNRLAYNGQNQDLITSEGSDEGTVLYSSDNVNYSENIPQAKEVGSYMLYYKVIGDFNHADSGVTSIEASIYYPDGLTRVNGTWYYYLNNTLQDNYTGLVEYNGAKYYVQNGVLIVGVNGLTKINGTWYYLKNSILQKNYTGLVEYNGGKYYVQSGVLIVGVNGLTKISGTWYYLKNSILQKNYTGVIVYNGTKYNIKNGVAI